MPQTKKKAASTTSSSAAPRLAPRTSYRLRRSSVHGTGLFAMRGIAKGTHLIEYTGQRISHAEADRRHETKAPDDNHTFFFTIDAKTVIDAGVRGNAARFINHSCDPNCEVTLVDGRPIVETLRAIRRGEEFSYDYNLTREADDGIDAEKLFACRCGTETCRGTMLAPKKKKTTKTRAAATEKPKAQAARKKPKASSKRTTTRTERKATAKGGRATPQPSAAPRPRGAKKRSRT